MIVRSLCAAAGLDKPKGGAAAEPAAEEGKGGDGEEGKGAEDAPPAPAAPAEYTESGLHLFNVLGVCTCECACLRAC